MCGQPCVPTPPCTARGLDNKALWLIVALRMQPWKADRSGTGMSSGAQTEAT